MLRNKCASYKGKKHRLGGGTFYFFIPLKHAIGNKKILRAFDMF